MPHPSSSSRVVRLPILVHAPAAVDVKGSPVASDASQQQALQHLPLDRRRSVDTDEQALPQQSARPRDRRPTPQRTVTDDASSSASTLELAPAARPFQWRLPLLCGFTSDSEDAGEASAETVPPPLLGCPPIVPVPRNGRRSGDDGFATLHSRRSADPATPTVPPLTERVSRWLAEVATVE